MLPLQFLYLGRMILTDRFQFLLVLLGQLGFQRRQFFFMLHIELFFQRRHLRLVPRFQRFHFIRVQAQELRHLQPQILIIFLNQFDLIF